MRLENDFTPWSEFAFDAVDGCSTGTEVPSMWAPLRLPRLRTTPTLECTLWDGQV
jgi:hypothetical protein